MLTRASDAGPCKALASAGSLYSVVIFPLHPAPTSMLTVISGFFLPFQGLKLILSPGLRRYVIVPLLLNLVVFAALAFIAGQYFEMFMDIWLPTQHWL